MPSDQEPLSTLEIVPEAFLALLGLAEQAHIAIVDTPEAAPGRSDRRVGTARLPLADVARILGDPWAILGV